MSRVVAIVGGTHRGKSTYIKAHLRNPKGGFRPHIINDIKGEYGKGFKKYHDSGDRDGFIAYVDQNVKNSIVVLEEASFYLSNRHYSSAAEKLLVNKWKSQNTYFIVYHSIRKIPLAVYDYLDYMVLFKTRDLLPNIKNAPPEVLSGFEDVNQKSRSNKHYHKFITLDDI